MDIFFLISVLRLFPGLKKSFEHNSVRKNLCLGACFCRDSSLSLREVDQKFVFGGLIGYWNPYLDSVFRYSKGFRLHAILHDAAGAVRSHSGKGPGYCYLIGQGPNSCLLSQVTGLLFCLYVKLFLPSIFNSVDFWSSMLLIVIDMELTEKNINKELVPFIVGSLQGLSIFPPKTFKPNKQTTWNTNIYMELRGVVESWTMRSCLLSLTT